MSKSGASDPEDFLSEPPEGFGEFLKRHREASGKSLEEIARVTRISRRYLEAFENNDESNMPEEAFARGFLKNYANEVGLDAEDCLLRFDRFRRSTMPTQIREPRSTKSKIELGVVRSSSMQPILVGLGFLVIVVILYFVFQGIYSRISSGLSEPAGQGLETETSPSSEPESSRPETLSVTPSTVVLSADRNVTLVVRLDEFAEQEIFLSQGEERSFEVFRKIEFRDTQAATDAEAFEALRFVVNGRPMARPSSRVLPILNQNIMTSDQFMGP